MCKRTGVVQGDGTILDIQDIGTDETLVRDGSTRNIIGVAPGAALADIGALTVNPASVPDAADLGSTQAAIDAIQQKVDLILERIRSHKVITT